MDIKADLLSIGPMTFKEWGALECTGSTSTNQTAWHCRCSPLALQNGESVSMELLVHKNVWSVTGFWTWEEEITRKANKSHDYAFKCEHLFNFINWQMSQENQGPLHHLPLCSRFLSSCQKKKNQQQLQKHFNNHFLKENRLFRFILSNVLKCLNIFHILSLPAISLQLLRKNFIWDVRR